MSDQVSPNSSAAIGQGYRSPPSGSTVEPQQTIPDRQKFSRYRSVRNAAASKQASPPKPSAETDSPVKRSMSRYKSKRPVDPPGHIPAVPQLYSSLKTTKSPAVADVSNKAQQEAYKKLTGGEIAEGPPVEKTKFAVHAEQRTRRMTDGQDQTNAPGQQQRYRTVTRRAATEPTKHSSDHAMDNPSAGAPRRPSDGAPTDWGRRAPAVHHQQNADLIASPETASPGNIQARSISANHGPSTNEAVRPGGFDAPISAVNAGTRTVILEIDGIHVSLQVEPGTTPFDLMELASIKLPDQVDPYSNLLVESFSQIGLERPLRHYEHIRDVMNSWDRDGQNTLQILSSSELSEGVTLRKEDAPTERPGETSVHMYYSHKPGSWDKRWVTLRSDGQVVVAKDTNAPAKEHKNICHMTDFDVYMPTARRLKKLHPPRKYCIAIKSQQKSAMFESTTNFVHFFCAKDKELTSQWYQAAQRWRSWYMITQMGWGDGMGMPAAARAAAKAAALRQDAAPGRSAQASNTQPARTTSRPNQSSPQAFSRQLTMSSSRRAEPSSSTTRKLTKSPPPGAHLSIIQHPAPKPEADPFAANGLLGHNYNVRQKTMQERMAEQVAWPGPQIASLPAVEDYSLHPIGEGPAEEDETPRSKSNGGGGGAVHGGTGLSRSHSTRAAPKPLLDFGENAHFKPPPQHAREASRSASGPANGLVSNARHVDDAFNKPVDSAAVGFTESEGGGTLLGGAIPPKSVKPSLDGVTRSNTLRRAGTQKTRKDGEPLLDLARPAEFAPGSLLASVQKYEDDNDTGPTEGKVRLKNGTVIDTNREGREVLAKYGEGM